MKLAIVFEVPDDDADELFRTGVQIIELRARQLQRAGGADLPDYWQFPGKMVPVAVARAETDNELVTAMDKALSSAS